jgi:hypothetical protein
MVEERLEREAMLGNVGAISSFWKEAISASMPQKVSSVSTTVPAVHATVLAAEGWADCVGGGVVGGTLRGWRVILPGLGEPGSSWLRCSSPRWAWEEGEEATEAVEEIEGEEAERGRQKMRRTAE